VRAIGSTEAHPQTPLVQRQQSLVPALNHRPSRQTHRQKRQTRQASLPTLSRWPGKYRRTPVQFVKPPVRGWGSLGGSEPVYGQAAPHTRRVPSEGYGSPFPHRVPSARLRVPFPEVGSLLKRQRETCPPSPHSAGGGYPVCTGPLLKTRKQNPELFLVPVSLIQPLAGRDCLSLQSLADEVGREAIQKL
jgi:hypothetical protein